MTARQRRKTKRMERWFQFDRPARNSSDTHSNLLTSAFSAESARDAVEHLRAYLAALGTPYAIESVEHEPGGSVTVAARVRL